MLASVRPVPKQCHICFGDVSGVEESRHKIRLSGMNMNAV